jgi:hypothetical protein
MIRLGLFREIRHIHLLLTPSATEVAVFDLFLNACSRKYAGIVTTLDGKPRLYLKNDVRNAMVEKLGKIEIPDSGGVLGCPGQLVGTPMGRAPAMIFQRRRPTP